MSSWRYDSDNADLITARDEREMAIGVVVGLVLVLALLRWGPGLIEAALHLLGW